MYFWLNIYLKIMKKITVIFSLLIFIGFSIMSCTSQEEQAKTEKQILEEMNKTMQDTSVGMSIDTSSAEPAMLK